MGQRFAEMLLPTLLIKLRLAGMFRSLDKLLQRVAR